MSTPAASLRGGAVGASTVTLGVLAHGVAGGGYPAGSALVFLVTVGIGVGAVASLPDPRSGRGRLAAVLGALVFGQAAAHVALGVGNPHEMVHAHSLLPSPTMWAFHVAASAIAAVLVCGAERLYGPITSIVRAVLDPPRLSPTSPAHLVVGETQRFTSAPHFTTSISRRGPPLSMPHR